MAPDEGRGERPTGARAGLRAPSAEDRETALDAREALQEDREETVQRIIADADARDEKADARDAVADHDDIDARSTHDDQRAGDRLDSKIDRTSSAQDRSELSEVDGVGPEDAGGIGARRGRQDSEQSPDGSDERSGRRLGLTVMADEATAEGDDGDLTDSLLALTTLSAVR